MTMTQMDQVGCLCCNAGTHQPSRRAILRTGIGGLVASAAIGATLPKHVFAQTTRSPDAALQALLDGNKRFANHQLTSFDDDLAILKQNTVAKQEPFAAVLSCADSRVPVELVFDQSIGHLFVTRVAGNIASWDIIASLEYGAAVPAWSLSPRMWRGWSKVEESASQEKLTGRSSRLWNIPALTLC
jgi:carbonic anhydrase